MAQQADLDRLMQGVTVWNQWREAYPEIQPDLTQADLIGADLREANFRCTTFVWTGLGGARLDGADLHEADLMGADLSDTDDTRKRPGRPIFAACDRWKIFAAGSCRRDTSRR